MQLKKYASNDNLKWNPDLTVKQNEQNDKHNWAERHQNKFQLKTIKKEL